MAQSSSDRVVFRKFLSAPSDAPFRFVLAALVGSDRLWAILVVGIPVVSLLASSVNSFFARVAAGSSVILALWLVWMSHEFTYCRTTFDVNTGSFAKSKPYGGGEYPAVELDNIDEVTIIRFGTTALVKFGYSSSLSNNTPAVVIDNSDTSVFTSHLKHPDVEVRSRSVDLWSMPIDRIHLRIITASVILIGIPVIVWLLHGADPFKSNVVIVPLIVLIGTAIYGMIKRERMLPP
ncbi:hypothetical protein ACFQE1_05700 [Halobium palmae]|uniref:PH domain-containing protein n=1 Tax=Halobium palmae TaxID=1776492 RepID=A0ABD5RWU6_9EURY